MIAEITAAFRALDADADVRAIILAGEGKAFCAGADLNWMKKREMSGYTFEQNYDDALGLANMLHTIHAVKKPTLARVHGAAFAGGIGLVAACDIAIAGQSAEFCLSEVKLGLVPATIQPVRDRRDGRARGVPVHVSTAEPFEAAEAYPHRLRAGDRAGRGARRRDQPGTGTPGFSARRPRTPRPRILLRAVGRQPLGPDLIKDTATRIAVARASGRPARKESARSSRSESPRG